MTDNTDSPTEVNSKNLFGYFQSKRFLSKNKKEILLFAAELRRQFSLEQDLNIIHFRLGDSVMARRYMQYYEAVRELVKKSDEEFIVATDSPAGAKEFFQDCFNVNLSSSDSAIDDFALMLSASRLFCAPSTFSWWAAHALDPSASVVIPRPLIDDLGFYGVVRDVEIIEAQGRL